MARNEQLIRQHKLLEILERYRFGRTLEELRDDLTDELGLSSLHTRTVRRDMDALQRAGIHVEQTEIGRGKVWKLGAMFKGTHKITATPTEVIALSLSRDLLYPLAGTAFWQGIESFWTKLRDQLPGEVWDHYEKYRKSLFVRGMPAKSYERQQGILSAVNRCIEQHRVMEIDYAPIGRPRQHRKVEPLAVVFFQSSLYIIAAANEIAPDRDDRLRNFKLDRFQKATALDEWFKPPKNFDLNEYLGQSLGIFSSRKPTNYKIRISEYAAPWVLEDPWHAEQQVAKQPDGSIVLTVKAAHEMELIPRVLALGAEAEVIAPAACRRRIAELVSKLVERYRD